MMAPVSERETALTTIAAGGEQARPIVEYMLTCARARHDEALVAAKLAPGAGAPVRTVAETRLAKARELHNATAMLALWLDQRLSEARCELARLSACRPAR